MKIKSQCHRTDLFFEEYSGEITEQENFVIIRTPKKPDYYWGNYLIFRDPPKLTDVNIWTKQFDDIFKSVEGNQHRSLSWDVDGMAPPLERDIINAFEAAGYGYIPNISHELGDLTAYAFMNDDIEVRPVSTDQEWADVFETQYLCWVKDFEPVGFRQFKEWQVRRWQELVKLGRGCWFGAYKEGQHAGNAGVFWSDSFARYQSVSVHPDYRGMGICGTLVHNISQWVAANKEVQSQVIVAEEDTSAMKIYQSLGFRPKERIEQFFMCED